MRISRRRLLNGLIVGGTLCPLSKVSGRDARAAAPERASRKEERPVRFVRFQRRRKRAYGIVDKGHVRELEGNPFDSPVETDRVYPLGEVKLLCPCKPSKVLAMAGNYRSHIGDTPPPTNPEVFFKAPSALLAPEGTITIPQGTKEVHCEGELVVVIGKKTKNVSPAEAATCVFGVTCGNDVSARDWQRNDRQWWRAKGSDTFGPLGPWIVRGIDYGDLLLTTRLNGEVKQRARTSDLIFSVPVLVSFISKHMTLLPGDVIYTGTPGRTSAIKSGDVVEVEIEKIGVLKNRVG